jgi:hypothetical protein
VPGNLEALLILPEHTYGVKQKPLISQRFSSRMSTERSAASKPGSRAPKAAKRTLDAGARTRPTTPTMDQGPGGRRGLTSDRDPRDAGALQATGIPATPGFTSGDEQHRWAKQDPSLTGDRASYSNVIAVGRVRSRRSDQLNVREAELT